MPIPVSDSTTKGFDGSSLVIVNWSGKVPAAAGEKTIVTLVEAWGASENGPAPEAEKGAPLGPLTLPCNMPLPLLTIFSALLA